MKIICQLDKESIWMMLDAGFSVCTPLSYESFPQILHLKVYEIQECLSLIKSEPIRINTDLIIRFVNLLLKSWHTQVLSMLCHIKSLRNILSSLQINRLLRNILILYVISTCSIILQYVSYLHFGKRDVVYIVLLDEIPLHLTNFKRLQVAQNLETCWYLSVIINVEKVIYHETATVLLKKVPTQLILIFLLFHLLSQEVLKFRVFLVFIIIWTHRSSRRLRIFLHN